jgi:hypothetical protein
MQGTSGETGGTSVKISTASESRAGRKKKEEALSGQHSVFLPQRNSEEKFFGVSHLVQEKYARLRVISLCSGVLLVIR